MKSTLNQMNCLICQCYDSRSTTEMTYCPNGMTLDKTNPNKKICKDINECMEYDSICGDKLCKNTIGDYECYSKAVVYYSPREGM